MLILALCFTVYFTHLLSSTLPIFFATDNFLYDLEAFFFLLKSFILEHTLYLVIYIFFKFYMVDN